MGFFFLDNTEESPKKFTTANGISRSALAAVADRVRTVASLRVASRSHLRKAT